MSLYVVALDMTIADPDMGAISQHRSERLGEVMQYDWDQYQRDHGRAGLWSSHLHDLFNHTNSGRQTDIPVECGLPGDEYHRLRFTWSLGNSANVVNIFIGNEGAAPEQIRHVVVVKGTFPAEDNRVLNALRILSALPSERPLCIMGRTTRRHVGPEQEVLRDLAVPLATAVLREANF